MPSEMRTNGKSPASPMLTALAPRVEVFRAAVETAREAVAKHAILGRGGEGLRTEWALVELGPFALGRIDPERFARLQGEGEALTPDVVQAIDRAAAVLEAFAAGTDPFHVVVEPGGDLRDAVKHALTHVGRVFGAARVVELARSGGYDEERHAGLLSGHPFRAWNRAERRLAPPLVVEVRGEDCLPAGLGEFLDGAVCIVLDVKGPTTPAPLARLITPGTFVLQTHDVDELPTLAASPHPGVAVLFDERRDSQATFVHDPDVGNTPWSRLRITHTPQLPDVGRGGREPVWLEELTHLRALAERPPQAPVPEVAEPGLVQSEVPADKLAAWLLTQTELGEEAAGEV